MSKTLRALLVVAGIAGSTVATAQSIPPSQGIPVCAAVYGTMARFAAPEDKQVLQNRAMQLVNASTQYSSTGARDALAQLNSNIARVNANDPRIANEVIAAEKGCRTYLKQYGL